MSAPRNPPDIPAAPPWAFQNRLALDKLFSAGFTTEKQILNMQLEDLSRLDNISNIEINIIIEFKKAIKNKKLVAFLSDNYKEERNDRNA